MQGDSQSAENEICERTYVMTRDHACMKCREKQTITDFKQSVVVVRINSMRLKESSADPAELI